jgi:hypothetical protein
MEEQQFFSDRAEALRLQKVEEGDSMSSEKSQNV